MNRTSDYELNKYQTQPDRTKNSISNSDRIRESKFNQCIIQQERNLTNYVAEEQSIDMIQISQNNHQTQQKSKINQKHQLLPQSKQQMLMQKVKNQTIQWVNSEIFMLISENIYNSLQINFQDQINLIKRKFFQDQIPSKNNKQLKTYFQQKQLNLKIKQGSYQNQNQKQTNKSNFGQTSEFQQIINRQSKKDHIFSLVSLNINQIQNEQIRKLRNLKQLQSHRQELFKIQKNRQQPHQIQFNIQKPGKKIPKNKEKPIICLSHQIVSNKKRVYKKKLIGFKQPTKMFYDLESVKMQPQKFMTKSFASLYKSRKQPNTFLTSLPNKQNCLIKSVIIQNKQSRLIKSVIKQNKIAKQNKQQLKLPLLNLKSVDNQINELKTKKQQLRQRNLKQSYISEQLSKLTLRTTNTGHYEQQIIRPVLMNTSNFVTERKSIQPSRLQDNIMFSRRSYFQNYQKLKKKRQQNYWIYLQKAQKQSNL